MSSNTTENKAPKKESSLGRGGKIAIIVGGIVIVILIGIILWLLFGKDDEKKRNVVVTPDNVDEVIEEMEQTEFVAPGSYQVTMNNTWNFPDGSSPSSNAYVENATANTNSVYFDILLADTEEVIYSSPILPIGSHLEDITLDKDLEAGNYDCVIKYTLIDENGDDLSSVRVSMSIVVEN